MNKSLSRSIAIGAILLIVFSGVAMLGGAFGAGAPYTVTFVEHGLPPGTTWGIAWNNTTKSGTISNTTYSGGGSTSVALYNGSYEFKIIGTPWYFNSSIGKFTVSGNSETIQVNFSYYVDLDLSADFKPGINWSVTFDGKTYYDTIPSGGVGYINIKTPASTQNQSIYFNDIVSSTTGTAWAIPEISQINGTFISNFSYQIQYIPIRFVNIHETGIPINHVWGIKFNGAIAPLVAGNSTLDLISQYGSNNTLLNITNFALSKDKVWAYPGALETTYWLNTTSSYIQIATAEGHVFNFNPAYFGYQLYNLSYQLVLPNKMTLSSVYYDSSIVGAVGGKPKFNISGQFAVGGNTTITFNFVPTFAHSIIEGYTAPNATIFYPSYYYGHVISTVSNKTTGFYKINATGYPILFFHKAGYAPAVKQIPILYNGTYWLNVSLSQFNMSLNISKIVRHTLNYTLYNMSLAPINFSYYDPVNETTVSRIAMNEIYLSSVLEQGNISLILPVKKGSQYIIQELTNISDFPRNIVKFNATSNYYNLTWNNWSLDPILEYSSPEAVISAPSAVPYDTAVIISGANSIPSENASITNYTWHIIGPENFTAYGKSITEYFVKPGIYKIELTVYDSNGLTNTTSTSLSVLASNQTSMIKISLTHTFNSQKNTYYFLVYVNMTNNVSISQITVSVDGKYVNITLYKEIGYDYVYAFNLSNSRYGYGNHTIKVMVFDSLGQYNSFTTYLVFGSVSGVGIINYITMNTLLLVATAFVILAAIVFLYYLHVDATAKRRKRR